MAGSKDRPPIGDVLREQRVNVLGRGLREMAKLLQVTPAYVTGLETGTRSPSEPLLVKIAHHYQLDEKTLRVGWGRSESVVKEIATQDETTAQKVPEFLRTARNLSPEQWDKLIRQAKAMGKRKRGQD